MTTNLTPNSSPDDIPGVVEIIKLLSDSDAFSKRLAELRGLAATADSKLADAKALQDKYASVGAMVADATRMLADHKRRNDELSDRANGLNARERDFARAQSEHGAHVQNSTQNLADREHAVSNREQAATSKAAELKQWERALQQRETAIAAREAKMREIARSFKE